MSWRDTIDDGDATIDNETGEDLTMSGRKIYGGKNLYGARIGPIASREDDLPPRTIPLFKLDFGVEGRPDLVVVPIERRPD
jgi:hypothetical protein